MRRVLKSGGALVFVKICLVDRKANSVAWLVEGVIHMDNEVK
jgi:hypothetical protein